MAISKSILCETVTLHIQTIMTKQQGIHKFCHNKLIAINRNMNHDFRTHKFCNNKLIKITSVLAATAETRKQHNLESLPDLLPVYQSSTLEIPLQFFFFCVAQFQQKLAKQALSVAYKQEVGCGIH